MIGTKDLFVSLSGTPSTPSVSIADGSLCSILGEGVIQTSSSLNIDNVLYVPNFHTNLLSFSKITKSLNYSVTIFPYYCTFQDLQME